MEFAMNRAVHVLSAIFGYMFLALSFLISAETLARKLFKFSFQGVDELGGYALAIGSSLAFSIAMVERAHIRIDLLHERFSVRLRAWLNWLSVTLLAAFSLFLIWICWTVLADTLTYGSTAQTPWATPLIYPQGIWYAALVLFAFVGVWLAVRASMLLFHGRLDQLNAEFHPKGAIEELQDELEDVGRR
jgi:TRAP-type C4-dicarboxylate transport system permease small subunit